MPQGGSEIMIIASRRWGGGRWLSDRSLAAGIIAFATVAALLQPAPAMAEAVAPGPNPLRWAQIGALPDFTTGIWEIAMTPAAFASATQPAPTPLYAERAKAFLAAQAAGKAPQDAPTANCLPSGMPQIMGQPYPMQIMFGPREVTIDIEAFMQVRHIYTDGRPHPTDVDPTFNGNSIGHWEGKTLVVDTVGFVPDTALNFDWSLKHSDKMHITERFRLKDPDTLEVVTTVEDPEALTQPWVSSKEFKRHAAWTIAEYICEQNNRNVVSESGAAQVNLVPPSTAH